ncbi:hypothetical protein FDECE_3054 [Fusarium decemcellulare]|nr:hypothetical protein FDECE_3054 [Fusarium decemcellulare]
MDDLEAAYKQKCRHFFALRYKARIDLHCPTPYPIPASASRPLDHLLPYLLNDKEFYQARVYASSTPTSKWDFELGTLLWEALGTAPNDFMGLCDLLVNPKCLFWRTYRNRAPDKYSSRESCPSLHDLMVELSKWGPADRDIGFRNVLLTLQSYSTALHNQNSCDFWHVRPSRNHELYPLHYGLMVYVEEQWNNLAWVYLDAALSKVPDIAHPEADASSSAFIRRIQNDKIYDYDDKKESARAVHVLFSAAGTGKTRQIFELLQHHWGFYMLPPNLEPTQVPPSGWHEKENIDILGPQRYAASRDTYTMFDDHPQMGPNWGSDSVNVFQAIIVSRVALLHEFLLRHPSPTPTKWLWLQISCAMFDPFDALYRLFRLADTEHLGLDAAISIGAEMPGYLVPKCYAVLEDRFPQSGEISLCYCIDEAQTTIDSPQASAMFGHLYDALSLFYALSRDAMPVTQEASQSDQVAEASDGGDFIRREIVWQINDEMPIIDPILVVSGTSLNLDKVREMLANCSTDTWGSDEPAVTKWEAYLLHDTFPLVSSDADFWNLYQQHLTDIISEISQTRGSLDANDGFRLPLLGRSGRPFTLQDGIDFIQLRKWLWKPLEVLGHPQSGNNPSHLEPLGEQVVLLLAGFGKLNTYEVWRMIQSEANNPVAPASNFHDMTKTLHQHLRNIYVRQLITSHSVGHRGRYRWSTIYLEELMSLSQDLAFRHSSLAEIRSTVEQARSNTSQAAVEALKSQIRKMKASGKTALVQDLFRAGIRAEMMSIPTIFLDESYAQLVTYGFALTQREGATLKYTIAEPIAIHAVMDYLRTEGRGDYYKLMLQWLVHTQDDHDVQAMFGKATEWFVAMSLDRLLHQPNGDVDEPNLLSGSIRREVLLKLLSESVSLDSRQGRATLKLKSVFQMDDLVLVRSPTVHKYHTPDTIWDWMRHHRAEGRNSASTFMFPDTKAGPDLVFILENQSTTRNAAERHHSRDFLHNPANKIFVAAQIKTGRSARFEEAMETLLDSNWHKSIGKTARNEELTHWAGTPFLLILICTGITVRQDRIDAWMRNNSGRIGDGRFFCVLDETVTSDIWGPDFVALADAIKTRKFERMGCTNVHSQGYDKESQNHLNETMLATQLPARSKKRSRNT